MKIPEKWRREGGESIECYFKNAFEFAKANGLKVHSDPHKVLMHASLVIHDAIVEGN